MRVFCYMTTSTCLCVSEGVDQGGSVRVCVCVCIDMYGVCVCVCSGSKSVRFCNSNSISLSLSLSQTQRTYGSSPLDTMALYKTLFPSPERLSLNRAVTIVLGMPINVFNPYSTHSNHIQTIVNPTFITNKCISIVASTVIIIIIINNNAK